MGISMTMSTELLRNGFTTKGLFDLIKKSKLIKENILETANSIISLLNEHVSEGGIVSYRLLSRYINDVSPEMTEASKEMLKEIITKGTKFGNDIQRDYYSELPEGLIEEMRRYAS